MKLRSLFLTVGLLFASIGPVHASTVLWYNGDLDSQSGGTVNEVTSNIGFFNTYEDFTVGAAGGWTLDRIWSNNRMSVTGITQATWSIRTGVSPGNAGTEVISGTSAVTQTATGRPGGALPDNYLEYKIEITGLNIHLGPGTYWVSVSPDVGTDSFGVLKSYNSLTFGVNAVGTPTGSDANGLLNAPALGFNYAPLSGISYSMGVAGVAVTAVPEPSTIMMASIGFLALAGLFQCKAR